MNEKITITDPVLNIPMVVEIESLNKLSPDLLMHEFRDLIKEAEECLARS